VWAPSAREMAALEDQVKVMAQQLSSQQQQWQAFFSAAQSQLPALSRVGIASGIHGGGIGLCGSGTGSPNLVGGLSGADAGSAVREKLTFLQGEVEKVIKSALAMQQQQQHQGGGVGLRARSMAGMAPGSSPNLI
jgi:hypothetical protein